VAIVAVITAPVLPVAGCEMVMLPCPTVKVRAAGVLNVLRAGVDRTDPPLKIGDRAGVVRVICAGLVSICAVVMVAPLEKVVRAVTADPVVPVQVVADPIVIMFPNSVIVLGVIFKMTVLLGMPVVPAPLI
jgi:hypothetical protein